jgi:hypothetical protein
MKSRTCWVAFPLPGGGLYLTGHLRCCAALSASFGPRGLSHGFPRKQELPCGRPPASCVAVPVPHPWHTEDKALDAVARRALLLAPVSAPQVLLDSGVGGAGADEGQARVNRFVVIAPCPRRHPQPVLLESATADFKQVAVEASLRLGPGPRLGSEEVWNRDAGAPELPFSCVGSTESPGTQLALIFLTTLLGGRAMKLSGPKTRLSVVLEKIRDEHV